MSTATDVPTWTYARREHVGLHRSATCRARTSCAAASGARRSPACSTCDTPSLSQDFDWTKGAHSISFGGSWTRPHPNGDGTFQANGNMGFNGIFTSGTTNANGGLNMADFVLGYPNSYRGGGSQINNAWVHSIGLYVADVWRVSRRLTLNYGLRWEPYISAKDANGFNTAFIRENFDKGIRSTVYTNAPIGLVFPGDPGFPTNGGEHVEQVGAVRAASRRGLGSEGRQHADDSRRRRHLLRLAEALGNGAPHAEPAVRQHGRTRCAPTSCPGKPNRNGCPLDFVKSVERDARRRSAGERSVTRANRSVLPGKNVVVPAERRLRQHAGRRQSDAVSISGTCPTSGSSSARMLVEVTYTGNKTEHIWVPGYEENPVDLHSRELRSGSVRADGAGAVLEHLDRQPAGARAPHAAQPGGRQVLRRERRGAGVSGRDGALQRREAQPAEAPAATTGARTPTTRSASASTRVSRAPTSAAARSRCRSDRSDQQPASGSDDERRPVRGRPPAQLQPVVGGHQPRASAPASSTC